MVFLELNHRYYTEMERVAGSSRQKCHFLNSQLIGLARVFNKNKRKFVLLQNLFSSLLSKMYYFCFIHKVSFGFEPTSYGCGTSVVDPADPKDSKLFAGSVSGTGFGTQGYGSGTGL
jgi:hypothetical protein